MVMRVERIGNAHGKLLYEATRPSNTPKPDANCSSSEIERYIRRKYEQKIWFASDLDGQLQQLLTTAPVNTTPSHDGTVADAKSHHAHNGAAMPPLLGGASAWSGFVPSPTTPATESPAVQPAATFNVQPSTAAPVSVTTQPPRPTQVKSDDFWDSLGATSAAPQTVVKATAPAPDLFGAFATNPHHSHARTTPSVASEQGTSTANLLDFGSNAKAGGNAVQQDILSLFGTTKQSYAAAQVGACGRR